MEVGAQGRAVAVHGDGIRREGIADEVADSEMHVERQICTNEGKAAGNYGFDSMLLAKERAEMFGGALALAVGHAGFGQGRTAWPVFGDGRKIGRL